MALDQAPEILDAVRQDLLQLSKGNRRRGRKTDFTSETMLRALIVVMVEGLAYRETAIRVAENEFPQDFNPHAEEGGHGAHVLAQVLQSHPSDNL